MFLKQRMQEIYDKKIPKDINMQIYCLCKCFCVKKYVSYVNGLSWSDKDCTTNRIWVAGSMDVDGGLMTFHSELI